MLDVLLGLVFIHSVSYPFFRVVNNRYHQDEISDTTDVFIRRVKTIDNRGEEVHFNVALCKGYFSARGVYGHV